MVRGDTGACGDLGWGLFVVGVGCMRVHACVCVCVCAWVLVCVRVHVRGSMGSAGVGLWGGGGAGVGLGVWLGVWLRGGVVCVGSTRSCRRAAPLSGVCDSYEAYAIYSFYKLMECYLEQTAVVSGGLLRRMGPWCASNSWIARDVGRRGALPPPPLFRLPRSPTGCRSEQGKSATTCSPSGCGSV